MNQNIMIVHATLMKPSITSDVCADILSLGRHFVSFTILNMYVGESEKCGRDFLVHPEEHF